MDLKTLVNNLKNRKIKKDQILILFLAGILLLIIAIPTDKKSDDETEIYEVSKNISVSDSIEYAEYLKIQLEDLLSKMEGAGDVEVMVTLSSSAEQVIEKDMEETNETVSETDSQGGMRTTNQSSQSESTIYNGEDGGAPYVSKEISPKVEGVVVIAEGGDNAVVVKNITESIQALFGTPSHKIRIVKKGG